MTRGRSRSRGHPRPAKMSHHSDTTSFVKRVLCKARVKMSEVLATLAYIDRAQPYLEISSDSKYLFERVFLGALIVATKFLNDSSLPNIHWAQCTRLFGKHDVCRIEREFLEVLDWELRLTEDDLLAHYDSLILVAFPKAPLSSVHRPFKLPASEECTHVEEREENMLHSSSLLSFPSSAHQRSNTNSPTRLPLTSYLFSPSSCLPTSVSPSTPDLEFDDTQLALDTDSDPSCSPPLLTPPSGLTLESDGNRCSGGRKNSDSFWDTFFSSMRIQEASSPILRFQERRQSSICH
ncbi:hypothetical protein J3R30DRAFT_3281810 [Lentinula aciculospora]|uniref:Cyclin N-terminal domain-containing protein n=1 Tax=Lentinula aciculospora TaxID=153920 RepID=A0A9W9ANW0_9AGAR|nr:hypothetical protein J3R30DRAFT_3281810 [Lentinula aciculospora]